MTIKYRFRTLSGFMLITLGIMVFSMISACKSDTVVTPSNGIVTQIQVVNLSPDLGGLYLYVSLLRQNATLKPYIFGTPSGYVAVNNTKQPFQLRTFDNTSYFTYEKPLTLNNRYTIFATGLLADKTIATIMTTDSSGAPSLGRGKVRFINTSARAINLDIKANGSSAFSNIPFKTYTDYIELPAGVYDFKVYTAGTTDALADLSKTSIQDGKLYTIYAQGVFGRTDSAKFTAGILTNR